MTSAAQLERSHGNAYEIFILVLTVMSLVIMALLLLPFSTATHVALRFYDNFICGVFLIDFFLNLTRSKPPRHYFIHERGWLDLLGSIPSFGGAFRFTALFRLARLSRLARIMRLLGGQNRKALVRDVMQNRGEYASFITVLLVFLVTSTCSVLVLQFESGAANGNIKTGGQALWWAFVTLTTVGYGDYFPVTTLGRTTAVALMFAGVGVIGALASILASLLVSPAPPEDDVVAPASAAAPVVVGTELAETRSELRQTRDQLSQTRSEIAELRKLLLDRGAGPSPTADGG